MELLASLPLLSSIETDVSVGSELGTSTAISPVGLVSGVRKDPVLLVLDCAETEFLSVCAGEVPSFCGSGARMVRVNLETIA